MVVREIVDAAGPRLPSKSKTPDTVVARDLAMDIKRRGEESIFIRVSPGRYTLKALVPELTAEASSNIVTPTPPPDYIPAPPAYAIQPETQDA
jgi:hypothetical protein